LVITLLFNHYIIYIMVIKVGVIEKDPFVINKDKLSGFSIDIWEHIAKKNKIDFKYVSIDKKKKIKDIIDEKKHDVILGVVNMTPDKIGKIDFTVPYYFTNYSLVSLKDNNYKRIINKSFEFFSYFLTYILISTFIFYLYHQKKYGINESFYNTITSLIPDIFSFKKMELIKKINNIVGIYFILLFIYYIYLLFFKPTNKDNIPNYPILVDSNNTGLIKYLKSRGAQVKIINDSGGLNNLLDIYLDDFNNLAGVFVSEEGKINKDGSIFNKNPKYQNLSFNRYNFGKSQVSILVKKDHPLFSTINKELIKMKETGELYKISTNWLNYAHSKQLEF
jgi:ABC-type amino acid transport substrate-binding protein